MLNQLKVFFEISIGFVFEYMTVNLLKFMSPSFLRNLLFSFLKLGILELQIECSIKVGGTCSKKGMEQGLTILTDKDDANL
jgi:hypothetical protein